VIEVSYVRKCTLVTLHAFKAYTQSTGKFIHSIPRNVIEVSGHIHTPATLLQKRRRYQLNRGLGGNQSQSGGFGE
jgi:hypothetical protein